jgi:hypothetical protein
VRKKPAACPQHKEAVAVDGGNRKEKSPSKTPPSQKRPDRHRSHVDVQTTIVTRKKEKE